jgi:hypothetical protein
MADLLFNKDYVNLLTTAKNQVGLNYRTGPGTSYKTIGTAPYGKSWGRTTGNYYKMSDGIWYQVILNDNKGYAWVREDVNRLIIPKDSPVGESEGKKLVDQLVSNDMKIHESLIRSANILSSAKAKGIDISSYQDKYKGLLARLIRRQDKIKNSRILSWKTGLKKGMDKLVEGFKSYVLTNFGIYIQGIGAIPIIAVVISAAAGAGLSIAAYFAFRPEYDESTTDLKISKELEDVLKNVDPETAGKIKADLEKQVDTAYSRGKTQGTFSGMFNIIKPIAFALVGFWGITKVLESQSKRRAVGGCGKWQHIKEYYGRS